MKRIVNLTKEHILLITKMRVSEFSSTRVGVDLYDLYGGSFIYDDMADILGYKDKRVPESIGDPDGGIYDDETQDLLENIDGYLHDNFTNIMEIILQFADRGLKPGKYVCNDTIRIWEYQED